MPRNVKVPLLGAVICLVALGLLAYVAYSVGPVERLDMRIVHHFQAETSSSHFPANVFIHLGDLVPLLALMAVVAGLGRHFGRRREAVAALAVIVGANITTQLLKVLLEHSRHAIAVGEMPYYWVSRLPDPDAFPSGHTTAAAAVGVALLFVVPARHLRSAAVAGVLLTAAVASAVVLLGWHYPSDALGAILVAALWGFLMVAVLRATSHPRPRPHHQEPAAVHGDLIASGD